MTKPEWLKVFLLACPLILTGCTKENMAGMNPDAPVSLEACSERQFVGEDFSTPAKYYYDCFKLFEAQEKQKAGAK